MTDEEKIELKRYPLHEYISTFYGIQFTKSGLSFVSNCPFHNEKTGSFTVKYDEKDGFYKYKCFGCGESGDIINFVTKMEKVDFVNAAIYIAQNLGITLSFNPPNPDHVAFISLMSEHCRRYHRLLLSGISKEALAFLEKRGISSESISRFYIGYVPPDEDTRRPQKYMYYARNSISIPIFECKTINSKVLAFNYRTLLDFTDPIKFSSSKVPKYVNDSDPSSDDKRLEGVFVKGNILFNYTLAFREAKAKESIIVVEGPLDAISLDQAGFKNVVATLTSGITENQADLLAKLSKNVILFADNDERGHDDLKKNATLLLSKGLSVEVFFTMNGKDANDLCLKMHFDHEKIKQEFEGRIDAVIYLINKAAMRYKSISSKLKASAIKDIAPILATCPEDLKIIYMDRLKKELDLN